MCEAVCFRDVCVRKGVFRGTCVCEAVCVRDVPARREATRRTSLRSGEAGHAAPPPPSPNRCMFGTRPRGGYGMSLDTTEKTIFTFRSECVVLDRVLKCGLLESVLCRSAAVQSGRRVSGLLASGGEGGACSQRRQIDHERRLHCPCGGVRAWGSGCGGLRV